MIFSCGRCPHLQQQGPYIYQCGKSGLRIAEHIERNHCPLNPKQEDRPPVTAARAATFIAAAITGTYISDQIRAEREAICQSCDKLRVDKAGLSWCGVCGCGVSQAQRQIRNLCAYEERLPNWGCKHPERAAGKGWKR